MSGEEGEIIKSIWAGKIPVVCRLSSREITSLTTPHPFYDILPRLSYCSVLLDKIKLHFESHISKFNIGQIWFEHKGTPLKWCYPIGALYDYYIDEKQKGIPFEIVVHFLQFPKENLMTIEKDKDSEMIFINSLKRGFYLRFGDSNTVMTMSAQNQKKLWTAVKESEYKPYKEVLESLSSDGEKQFALCFIYKEKNNNLRAKCDAISLEKTKNMKFEEFVKENDLGVKPKNNFNMNWLLRMSMNPDSFTYVVVKDK